MLTMGFKSHSITNMTTAEEYLNTLTGHFYSPYGAQQVKELASVLRSDADFADLGRPLDSQYEAQSLQQKTSAKAVMERMNK